MKKIMLVVSCVAFAFLLLVGSPLFVASSVSGPMSASAASSSQAVNLKMTGEVRNIARQSWSMSGGSVLTAYILGKQIDPGSGKLSYSMTSHIIGNNISGSGKLTFSATLDNVPVSVTGNGRLLVSNMNGGLCFPLTKKLSNDCDDPDYLQPSYLNNKSSSGYTSAIPFVFEGPTSFNIKSSSDTITTSGGFSIESAADNLFGGPIIIASGDQHVVIIANYSQASAQLDSVRFRGSVSGMVGSTRVSGYFVEVSNITENFENGVQREQGHTRFSTNLASLNRMFQTKAVTTSSYTHYLSPLPLQPLLSGGYAHTADCSWATGIEGTCKLAQLSSLGSVGTPRSPLQAEFVRVWTIPSAAFEEHLEGKT
jgi:hypothetical protein